MSDYRPITDSWLLARPKVKYYGAYPSGFLERARALLGVNYLDPVLHVCAGAVKQYPFFGFGPNDKTLDANPAVEPDFLQLATEPYPTYERLILDGPDGDTHRIEIGWPAVLIDRPYTDQDHAQYAVHQMGITLPDAGVLLRLGFEAVRMYGRVGMLDYIFPRPRDTKDYRVKLVAKVSVTCGYDNRDRCYSVYEKRPVAAPVIDSETGERS